MTKYTKQVLFALLIGFLLIGCKKDEPQKLESFYQTAWEGIMERYNDKEVKNISIFFEKKESGYSVIEDIGRLDFNYEKRDGVLNIMEGDIGRIRGNWVINELNSERCTLILYPLENDKKVTLKLNRKNI